MKCTDFKNNATEYLFDVLFFVASVNSLKTFSCSSDEKVPQNERFFLSLKCVEIKNLFTRDYF